MSITKTGIFNSPNIKENALTSIGFFDFSYTPKVDTNNSTAATISQIVDLSQFSNLNQDIQLQIECDFTWGDFSSGIGNGGTFNVRFQGSNRQKGTTSMVWQGTNYITTALNNQQSCLTLINNSSSGGTYHYSISCTIPASWFDTYDGSSFSFRTDYSNGIGTIQVSNTKIYIGNNTSEQAHIHNNYISGNTLYEY